MNLFLEVLSPYAELGPLAFAGVGWLHDYIHKSFPNWTARWWSYRECIVSKTGSYDFKDNACRSLWAFFPLAWMVDLVGLLYFMGATKHLYQKIRNAGSLKTNCSINGANIYTLCYG